MYFIVIPLTSIFLFTVIVYLYMQQRMFGRQPSGERQKRIARSQHYANTAFQNLNHTPPLTEGITYGSVMKEFFTRDTSLLKPKHKLPSVKTDLKGLALSEDVLVWFGHSSYLIQADGKRILVDPVMSGSASPVKFTTRAFEGADIYRPEELPEIDYLFITHDHWDHLDYQTMIRIRSKVRRIVCGLGTGEHLERWGFDPGLISEVDWHESLDLDPGFLIHTVPGRHFSGRGFSRNKALWVSFALQTPSYKLYLGGDSGYDSHFAEAGKKYGPFDLAILENGQYDPKWKYIHMKPEETLQAAADLRARRLLPVHSSKFALANHPWNEPLKRITRLAEQGKIPVLTPMIGEKLSLKNVEQSFTRWWEQIS